MMLVMKMENNIVKAFRQRLKRGGFTDISIYNQCNGKYSVYFNSRLIDRSNFAQPTLVYL